MPYATLPVGTKPTQNKTEAWLSFEVTGVDLYLWWSKSGGSPNGVLKATLERPDATTVDKLAEDGEVNIIWSAPTPTVKVLALTTDLTQLGTYKVLFEFKIDDGWVQAPIVTFQTLDDTVAG
jgi:hypothetical protein